MGIKGLAKVIGEKAEGAVKEQKVENYFGRKIAIDASMTLYQFLIAIRHDGPGGQLTDEFGEPTAHLNGLFYRNIRLLENGIKPVYVFDGKPPEMKGHELKKRTEAKKKASEEMKQAQLADDQEAVAKFEKRMTRVTKKQNEEAIKLLTLMGIPIVRAPGEAEAQCAELCKGGLVYATATEDMDALTFGTPRMVRRLTASQAHQKQMPIHEFNLSEVLEGLGMTMDMFIDFCILCGCDYTSTIRGVGPKKALQFLLESNDIESVVKALSGQKRFTIPDDFMYEQARKLFKQPDVTPSKDMEALKWSDPDRDGIIEYMVTEKGFNMERIVKGIERLKKSKKAGSQKRLDSFFKLTKVKRKNPSKTKGGPNKKFKKTRK